MRAEFTSLQTRCRYVVVTKPNAFNGHDIHVEKHGGMTGCYIGKAIVISPETNVLGLASGITAISENLTALKFN